jgi:hypothetical protein
VHYLAESLFQIGHDSLAREKLQVLVGSRDPQYLKSSVGRLIEIADQR